LADVDNVSKHKWHSQSSVSAIAGDAVVLPPVPRTINYGGQLQASVLVTCLCKETQSLILRWFQIGTAGNDNLPFRKFSRP